MGTPWTNSTHINNQHNKTQSASHAVRSINRLERNNTIIKQSHNREETHQQIPYSRDSNKMNTTPTPQVTILGIPFRGGQPKGGVDLAPTALRDAGLEQTTKNIGY